VATTLSDHLLERGRWEPLGRALLDYHRGITSARITVHTDLWQSETNPVEDYYRPDDQPLPDLEISALNICRGRTLDLGAGAGRHALELQERGFQVTAVDVSPEAVEVMRSRGVVDVRCGGLGAVAGERFDTILLLMHGIGLVGTLDGLSAFLSGAQHHLSDGGHIVFDSADLGIVIPPQFHEGLEEWRAGGMYPGEVEYRLSYAGLEGEPYPWLFVDEITLAERAVISGLQPEVVARGSRGAYLVRLTTLQAE
jgi:SAM-dependent methyltransferase